MDRPTIAWLGLGRMGTVMAGRLLDAGFEVGVWNRTASRADPLVERGARRIESIADASSFDIAFSMVLDDAALGGIHDADRGLSSTPGTDRRLSTWIDGSTVSIEAATRAADAAHAAGVAYVSAPVSGNPAVVESGRAIFAASGDTAGLDAADPVLAALGRATYRIGGGTEANVVKLATNALLAITMQSLAEVTVLGDKAGVSRAALMAFINDSAVGSPFSAYKTKSIVELDFTPTFTAEGQRKDIRLALALARRLEMPMPVLSTTEVAYSRLVSSGLGEGRDIAALILGVAADAGHTLEPEA